jgi:hypothetical protein
MLSSLACVRARLRFEEGRNAEALDDLVAALTLARHLSRDGTLDSLWDGYQIERRMGEALALHLPKLDARTIKDLKARLDHLPPGGSAATATSFMVETMLNWIVGEVREATDKESLVAFLTQIAPCNGVPRGKNQAQGLALLTACGGTAEGVLRFLEELRPGAVRLIKKLDLPPDQVEPEYEREEKKLAGNPMFEVFAPVLHKIRVRQAQAEIRRAFLLAAVAVQQGGQEALKHNPDPVVGGAFTFVPFDGGFELRSTCKLDENVRARWRLDPPPQLVLSVGRRDG